MTKIQINPTRLRQFGETRNIHFRLVTSASIAPHLEIRPDNDYATREMNVIASMEEFRNLLTASTIPEDAHILVIAPDVFFQSPPPHILGERRKLMAMACNSTPTSISTIAYFIETMERTDPEDQKRRTDRFFESGEASQHFLFRDSQYGTEAIFHHLDESYLWNEQTGYIGWGEQQIAPAGEISVLPLDIQQFNENLRLDINGQLAFKGQCVLHNGTPSYLRTDQHRIYNALDAMHDHAIIADVKDGQISGIRESHSAALPARRMLESMFEVDSRYSVIWEIGFAVNCGLRILRGNHAMNEVFGSHNGSMHWGLGLTPYTQYHLDIITPGTAIFNHDNELVFGGASAKMRRERELGCGCNAA